MTQAERPCHAITIQFCTPDRGKISLHWFISEERARDLAEELKDRIAEACDRDTVASATHLTNGRVTAIMQLPAVDLEERPRKHPGLCTQCGRCMLATYPRSGRVACLGCGLKGQIMPGTVSDGCVQWEDGTIT